MKKGNSKRKMGINKWINKYIREKEKDRRIYETDDNTKL